MKKKTIPTIVGLLFLIFGLGAGIILVQGRRIFRLGAESTATPKDVRITNISDTSFTVTWTTQNEDTGFVAWGKGKSTSGGVDEDEIGIPSLTHTTTINSLEPNTLYSFRINTDGEFFDNNGTNWQVTTGNTIGDPSQSYLASGTLVTKDGNPVPNALIYINVAGSSPLSTTTSENGSWVVPISIARSVDLTSYVNINPTNSLLEISVNAPPFGVATASVYPVGATPTPPIVISEINDFKKTTTTNDVFIPEAVLDLPSLSTPSSGFVVPEITKSSNQNITLESLSEGEVVTSDNPEFFGEGPPGETITITIESEPQTTQIEVGGNGIWRWNPPQNLSPGSHKITISWKDANGILQTLTRTFIVQAADGPAFETTPSASTPTPSPTPAPSPTPTPTPTKTPTPQPTATLKPTLTPKPTPAPTPSEDLPPAGTLTPTILLTIMGLGILFASFLVWKYSEN